MIWIIGICFVLIGLFFNNPAFVLFGFIVSIILAVLEKHGRGMEKPEPVPVETKTKHRIIYSEPPVQEFPLPESFLFLPLREKFESELGEKLGKEFKTKVEKIRVREIPETEKKKLILKESEKFQKKWEEASLPTDYFPLRPVEIRSPIERVFGFPVDFTRRILRKKEFREK